MELKQKVKYLVHIGIRTKKQEFQAGKYDCRNNPLNFLYMLSNQMGAMKDLEYSLLSDATNNISLSSL